MNALKCDRCKRYYDYDPTVRYNYISFGHKDIIPNKKQITKDICPECMEKFIDWLENPEEWSPEDRINELERAYKASNDDKAKLVEYYQREIKKLEAENEELDNMKLCNREKCKGCKDFGWVNDSKDAEAAWGYYTCNMMNKKVKNPDSSAFGALMITPKMFLESDDIIRDDDERVNELYKEAEDISNSAGEEKVE